jgi:hypothetical protein
MKILRTELQPEPVEYWCALNIIIYIMDAVMHEVSSQDIIAQVKIDPAGDIVVDIPWIDRYAAGLLGHVQIISIINIRRNGAVPECDAVQFDRCIEIVPYGVTIQVLAKHSTTMEFDGYFQSGEQGTGQ